MTVPKLYGELAPWWPLLSAPEDYREEAEYFRRILDQACPRPPRTLLELGSGGGNTASHLKAHYELTLVDLSPDMLAVSRALNPECEHLAGDMRELRLGRRFDAVLIHDAVMYLTGEDELRHAIDTCTAHCRPGGAALLLPDFVSETFAPGTDHGGRDGGGRGLRYLEWIHDPDPADSTYLADYAILLRDSGGGVRVEQDRHVLGLFSRDAWLRLLSAAGFQPRSFPDPWQREVFLAVRPQR